jgi:hypothetical protein
MPYGELLQKGARSISFEDCEKHTCGICGEEYIGSDILGDFEGGVVYKLSACSICFSASTIEDLVELILKVNSLNDKGQIERCVALHKTAGEWFRN